jgi:hypothetical protein
MNHVHCVPSGSGGIKTETSMFRILRVFKIGPNPLSEIETDIDA